METFDLDAARRHYPLPDGIEDVVVNRAQLATALKASENTVTKWLAKGMPCIQEGGNGRDYQLQLGDCYAWRMWSIEAETEAKRRADQAAAQLAMAFVNPDEEDEAQAQLSPKQIREFAEADLVRNKAAEMRRELVRAARVREVFEDVLVQFRTSTLTMVDFAEREFGLEPVQAAKLQIRADQVLIDARTRIEALLAPTGEVRAIDAGKAGVGD
ncbi:terminase small subunit [Roseibacterium beibuensis]|uniref:Terminase small subunit n=1 Tax=[Roseibacterium] beibuensis TaxID=1193142 RepID=A0ABP9LCK4_9RHOB|nr:terminase small subunit [Roseibacterium beibuensis]MCS6624350.1 terminase small subunit [Roseibacterium beibuensis]